ncbi:MAG: Dyp-type peroxidase [Rubrivivax sp.]
MQAFISSGFASLPACRYLLLQVTDAARARAWIGRLLDSGVVPNVGILPLKRAATPVQCAAMVAFTFGGLMALGLQEDPAQPFPSGFSGGMVNPRRSRLLGDDNVDQWNWVDAAQHDGPGEGRAGKVAHVLVGIFSAEPGVWPASVQAPTAHGDGLEIVREVETCRAYLRLNEASGETSLTEPFGFRDGISQPVIKGLRAADSRGAGAGGSSASTADDDLVEPGEFILGYINEYGEPAYCPDVKGFAQADNPHPFGMNGTYLVARQIYQDVEAFRRFETLSRAASPGRPSAAEKMMGRYKCGRPLVESPFPTEDLNDFRFRQFDLEGFQCPRGAHVRRANPRDLLGSDTPSGIAASKLHRLLRRGRVYGRDGAGAASCSGPCSGKTAPGETPDEPHAGRGSAGACGQGLFFVALNADLERQFEIVQSRWLANRRFNDLEGDDDVSVPTGQARHFSIQGLPTGRSLGPEAGLQDFTTVIGGGYFFLPGLRALRFIAAGARRPAPEPAPGPGPGAGDPGAPAPRASGTTPP